VEKELKAKRVNQVQMEEITTEMIKDNIKRKKNWTTPGPDGICNYWWKHLASSHLYLAIGFQYLAEGSKIPIWFASGITYRIPKDGPPSESNIRPITCVNCEYKVYSSILMRWIEKHVTFNSLLQVEQRGSRPGIWGTYENLFIDRVTTRDATQKTKTLCQAWLDITKAYDSTQHR
jgi:hypothetical protein